MTTFTRGPDGRVIRSSSNSLTGVSEALRKAQQALSEKYGIPTFDVKGNLSTIPQTRPATGINVGTGRYGTSVADFNNFIKSITPAQATVKTTPVVISGGTVLDIPVTSKLTEGEIPLSSRDIAPSFSTTIKKYLPYIILAGAGIAALMVFKR